MLSAAGRCSNPSRGLLVAAGYQTLVSHFTIGVESLLLQSYVPLCSEDDRHLGRETVAPRLGHTAMHPEGPTQWDIVPVKSAAFVRDAAFQVVMQYESRSEVP